MLLAGDIVSLLSPDQKNIQYEAGLFLVVAKNDTSDNMTAVQLSTDIKRYSSEQFAELLTFKELEHGSLEIDCVVLIDRITTVKTELCQKVASLKKDKLDRILRIFSYYAGYSYYKGILKSKKSGNYISPSGKVLDENELISMIDASLDMWLTAGRFHDDFEDKFAEFLGVRHTLAVNSGSSANLLALTALTSYKLGDRRLKEGDEIITVAAAFPTTVAPIVQNGLIPVFVDVELGTYNIDPAQIEKAVSDRTKAIFIAHTLGNPFNIDKVMELREKYSLFLIEDNCDALGSKYELSRNGSGSGWRYTGTFGDISTFSFYPAHHITMGEGGCVATDDPKLYKIMLSLRDWGRDCWCPTGGDNTCGQRFSQQHGKLPAEYDHKYVYSHLGYNLKITDWQAAVGLSQLRKLPRFIEKRKENFKLLYNGLKRFEEHLILPGNLDNSDPAWFGFPITVRKKDRFDRRKLVRFLEEHNIGTRQMFAGNILRQPAFVNNDIKIRIGNSGILLSSRLTESDNQLIPNTDTIVESTFWTGIWPGIDREKIEYMVQIVEKFIHRN